ncbi:Uncharacterized protein FWK35_00006376 [Aphis craccivora]|uniref:Uncharacterized protein n=1 Tax=Aphis craccivora TaxID=307492 RepID=A0A6G0ZL06_APHCR|nr:Uncharacterized protein FWK35_00006376 [Aphis craccivora]
MQRSLYTYYNYAFLVICIACLRGGVAHRATGTFPGGLDCLYKMWPIGHHSIFLFNNFVMRLSLVQLIGVNNILCIDNCFKNKINRLNGNDKNMLSSQNYIKKLRRENEQLKREIWNLREEYERLENYVKSREQSENEEVKANLWNCKILYKITLYVLYFKLFLTEIFQTHENL